MEWGAGGSFVVPSATSAQSHDYGRPFSDLVGDWRPLGRVQCMTRSFCVYMSGERWLQFCDTAYSPGWITEFSRFLLACGQLHILVPFWDLRFACSSRLKGSLSYPLMTFKATRALLKPMVFLYLCPAVMFSSPWSRALGPTLSCSLLVSATEYMFLCHHVTFLLVDFFCTALWITSSLRADLVLCSVGSEGHVLGPGSVLLAFSSLRPVQVGFAVKQFQAVILKFWFRLNSTERKSILISSICWKKIYELKEGTNKTHYQF